MAAGVVALAALGCESTGPVAQKYVEPQLPPGQAVIVQAHGGVYVTAVDCAAVSGTEVRLANLGGNRVVLSPGRHTIAVTVETFGSRSSSTTCHGVEYDFQAGHCYNVGRPSTLSSLQLTDETTGEKIRGNGPTSDPNPHE